MASKYESEYVHEVYDEIALHFNDTRAYIWPGVKDFLFDMEKNSLVYEVGCGNGRNLLYRDDCVFYGGDICLNLLNICKSKSNFELQVVDQMDIPFRSNMFDYSMSIAVLHHLSSYERRMKALEEIIRITKPGGQILIQVWAKEQPENSRRKFEKQDILVPYKINWIPKNKKQKMDFKRYYHVFVQNELKDMIKKFKNIKIIKSYYEVGNWCMVFEKI